jgi:hypothetical protein
LRVTPAVTRLRQMQAVMLMIARRQGLLSPAEDEAVEGAYGLLTR